MIEQQFLTTFNSIGNQGLSARFKDKKTNLIVDFINGTYQGHLSQQSEPEGLGTVIDDQFNFVVCSNWKKGKINGSAFIRLASQISIWGSWNNNAPSEVSCVKVGMYVMFIPYGGNGKVRRPKKCLICHEGKQKIYIATIERYPQGTQSKRQYSIVIEKIVSMRQKSIVEVASTVELAIQPYEETMLSYLKYMNDQVDAIALNEKENGLLVRANFKEDQKKLGFNLGLLLDKRKLMTKSVGMYSNRNNETTEEKEDRFAILNGIGLSKTMQSHIIIGIFKDDMLVRELNAQENIDSIRSNSKNYARNLNGSIVKELLGHEHMKSLSYQHNCVYFPQIKRVTAVAVELHKYVEMFERLTHQENVDLDLNQSMHHPTEKYANDYVTKQQSSSGSIIDQYPQFKINLAKQIYRDLNPIDPNAHRKKDLIMVEDQGQSSSKRPGFILSRTTRNLEMNQRNSRSPSGSPQPRLNLKLEYRRSPLKTEPKWKI